MTHLMRWPLHSQRPLEAIWARSLGGAAMMHQPSTVAIRTLRNRLANAQRLRRMLSQTAQWFVPNVMLPSAAMGQAGFQATSHAKPSGSAK